MTSNVDALKASLAWKQTGDPTELRTLLEGAWKRAKGESDKPPTVKAWAKEAGVVERMLKQWRHDDPEGIGALGVPSGKPLKHGSPELQKAQQKALDGDHAPLVKLVREAHKRALGGSKSASVKVWARELDVPVGTLNLWRAKYDEVQKLPTAGRGRKKTT